ncbi:uncharacterized protein J4E78_006502 [Alternaria triticimaculans]|uniref:uncharacterized protein n=1 Tax=Alternaria triticimaculans TaxID=297637 RepID=UPI0020C3D9E3|nr:uncharacterized protein J4E78_006502 [Alternaria triticimaculans]KAI4656613.1 hypothetical protein J4E78_006502 [Alternaria triticimaculans]
MLVQDVTRTYNVKDTWAGGEHGAILLDDGDYLDTNDMTPDEIAAWATHMDTENTACINVPSEARLAAVRAEVLQALAMMTCGAREFLEETEYDLEYGQDTFNMPGLFQSFKKEEARRSGMVESHIVSPSGYATSLLHLQLHYPTFTTKHLNDGQTLDATNCCIRILIEKGFVASNTYWFEAYFRRLSAASVRHLANVADGWKEEVKQLHDEFAYRCQSLSKKVLLVFGAFNRKRFHERHNVENITVRLSCGSTTLMGIVRNNAQKILFVVVYAWHPEYLLRNRTTAVGRQYDAALNIAAALSGVDTKAGYFEARAARTHEKSGRSPTQSKSTISQPPPSLALVTATERERERKNRANEAEALKKEPTQKTLRYRRTENHTRDVPLHIYRLSGLAIILTARLDDAFRQPVPPLTLSTLRQHFPSLPPWAVSAFSEIYNAVHIFKNPQLAAIIPQRQLSPESRALLNIAILPMSGYKYGNNKGPMLDCSVSIRELFEDEKSYECGKEQVVLVRLGRECEKLWMGRWDEDEDGIEGWTGDVVLNR